MASDTPPIYCVNDIYDVKTNYQQSLVNSLVSIGMRLIMLWKGN